MVGKVVGMMLPRRAAPYPDLSTRWGRGWFMVQADAGRRPSSVRGATGATTVHFYSVDKES